MATVSNLPDKQESRRELTVSQEAAGMRLDSYLACNLGTVSRSRIQLLLKQDSVLVDGAVGKASRKLRGGETIVILGDPEPPPLRAVPENISLDIVYEDEALAVINKPAGMMVHTGAGQTEDARNRGTLVNALLHHMSELSSSGGPTRPGIVHRLDKHTSGLIIVAKTDEAHSKLAAMFAARRVHKTYIALVQGRMKDQSGTVNASISRDLIRRIRMTTRREGGRTAISHWNVLRRIEGPFGRFTLVSVRIETGRTHQIRVHMSSLGHPIVGDTLYGAAAEIAPIDEAKGQKKPHARNVSPSGRIALQRNFLHAAQLEFIHPLTGQILQLASELPVELKEFMGLLAGQAGRNTKIPQ